MTQMQREELSVDQEKAILVGCLLPNDQTDPNDPLGELRSLASTAGAIAVDEILQKRMKPAAKTFIGKGKVEEIADLVKAHEASVVLFENDLSPSQIGNIEQVVECKVLDRSELILDIFAARAQTHEARLQVELAQLIYTYPRLRAMWSHLERIAGGAPAGIGTRGPGEQQLEIDRRIVQKKKTQLRRQIADIQARKTREVAARNKENYTVGLVGYTNAGKSTFFNTATDGGVYADDKLFATLSTRTRKWNLGDGDAVMLSDTVGFVRNLPHHLVASFRATLEESIHSDLLLIVLDVANPRAIQELDTVMQVLDDIGATEQPRALLLNKIDKLDHNADILYFQQKYPEALPISAATGKGFAEVVEFIRERSNGSSREIPLTLNIADGKSIQYLESRTTVLNREYLDDKVTLTVRIGRNQLDQLRAIGTTAKLPDDLNTKGGWGR
ncbi:GTPase HflX [Poriferisphaera corsica]|uniref:GTPase HflX n=1 Tax=Poriferisphaera corsica TaxID=2528020 RepID=A0A517YW48_9BACT|nr:GTPase HflX [Poriferisphaera corsica]QDU34464.1 GTPase HflX [Poriferisphaera corsica]